MEVKVVRHLSSKCDPVIGNPPKISGFPVIRFTFRWFKIAVFVTSLVGGSGMATVAYAQDEPSGQDSSEDAVETSENEDALASYADAANFQTQGELKLAIEQWQSFLKEFPEDPLAPRSAHYLGVCYMQLPEPEYQSAADAFSRALKSQKYGLREESLSNLGWCLYALASNPKQPQPEKLNGAIKAFETLLDEFPASKFADRALFYHGEALYAQGNAIAAIAKYDQLLDSRIGQNSSMRCDALYAKGVALEDLKQYDAATKAYREMLSRCGDDPLAMAVKTQLAEVLVLQGQFDAADKIFAELVNAGGEGAARALYRRAFVLTQLKRPDEAAALYDRLVKDFPDSEFAASAIMSAAQGYYLSGEYPQAKERFQLVVEKGTNVSAATEAAHWLTVMAMREGDAKAAEAIARRQLAIGAEGPYATNLKLDAAEAAATQPERNAEALAEFEQILADSPDDPLLSRILYNAAFTALQMGNSEKALQFTSVYFDKLPSDPLAADMLYISGEANLFVGNFEESVAAYNRLLEKVDADNPQYGFWLLRAASANFAAKKYETVISILQQRISELRSPAEKAEAYFLIGSSQFAAEMADEAIGSFQAGLDVDPQWRRNDEMLFRLAAAYARADQTEQAIKQWQQIIERYPDSKMSDQARYQLAQQALGAERFDDAVKWYETLLRNEADPVLKPFALYGLGRTAMVREDYQSALEPFNKLIEEFPQHGFYDDALLARGMTYRRLENLPQAMSDLQAFLELKPLGINLANALLEMAMIDRERQQPGDAIARLRRIVTELPDYPEIDKVRFELAELLRETGDSEASMNTFAELAERNPDSPFAADASYKVGQQLYANKQWEKAAEAYAQTALVAKDKDLLEKALYRLGWSNFQQKKFDESAVVFKRQADECPDGALFVDALMMVGESYFGQREYEKALVAYEAARKVILDRDGSGRKFTDPAEQQVRELVFLHGGQSAAQLERWKEALQWYESLRTRYPSSSYLSQVFYETGLAHRMSGDDESAIKFFTETANTFRDESSARARFMIGQIYFEKEKLADAITEFKRVMYGYGAEKAAESVKDWQAKSGFEAGRCAERLIQLNQGQKRQQAIELARKYYEYVVDNHRSHPLAAKAQDRAEVLRRL